MLVSYYHSDWKSVYSNKTIGTFGLVKNDVAVYLRKGKDDFHWLFYLYAYSYITDNYIIATTKRVCVKSVFLCMSIPEEIKHKE